ncbi:MAG: TIGR02147 family protein [Pseudobdellovibrionaceae bacterium]
MLRTKKTIFEYDNYRVFLKDFYAYSKAENKKFSYRYFARISDVGSPSFLKHVIDGQRNLTLPVIEKFTRALKLNKQETSFFKNLVLFNQATTNEEKEIYAQELLKHKLFIKFQPLTVAQLSYYEHWYYVAIRELASLKGFKEDPEWIAQQLSPPITPNEARMALSMLIKIGLLKYDKKGQLIQCETLVSTGNEVTSALVSLFHKEMMKKAAEAIDRYPKPKREISCATFGVSEETFKLIKERTQKFRKEMQEIASQDPNQDFVCQLNFQVFPLSLPEDDNHEAK